jgi:chromosomal replication initiator protein
MYLIRELTSESFQEIGRHFGDRDHTTVMHAYRKIQLAQQSDAAIRTAVTQLQRRLSADRLPLPTTTTEANGSPLCG